MKKYIIIISMLISFNLIAKDLKLDINNNKWFSKFSKQDLARTFIFSSLVFVDWYQTAHMIQHDFYYKCLEMYKVGECIKYEKHQERNPLLGKYPSIQTLATWCSISIASYIIISKILPEKYRKIFQWVVISCEFINVTNNITYKIGFDMLDIIW